MSSAAVHADEALVAADDAALELLRVTLTALATVTGADWFPLAALTAAGAMTHASPHTRTMRLALEAGVVEVDRRRNAWVVRLKPPRTCACGKRSVWKNGRCSARCEVSWPTEAMR